MTTTWWEAALDGHYAERDAQAEARADLDEMSEGERQSMEAAEAREEAEHTEVLWCRCGHIESSHYGGPCMHRYACGCRGFRKRRRSMSEFDHHRISSEHDRDEAKQ